MIDINENLPEGATPIDPDEQNALRAKHVTMLSELNELEQKNISRAVLWLNTAKKRDFISTSFLKKLHKRMFEDVWKWAGEFRRTNKNIGCEWQHIPVNLQNLLLDVEYWLNNKIYDNDEIAIRLHHKLVWIHPFPNGNGRHARLFCDVFVKMYGLKPFTWGRVTIHESKVRKEYIEALRAADNKDYTKLIQFVRN